MPEAHLSKEPPFKRGETWYNGEAIPATLPTGTFPGGWGLEGQQFIWQDSQTDTGNPFNGNNAGGYGTGFPVVTRVVRNNAAYNIKPGQLVLIDGTSDYNGNTIVPGQGASGITATEAAHCFPADEYLPPAGVPPGDLFYVVVSGPCMVKTAASMTAAIAIGDKLVSATSTAGTTDGNEGAVIKQDLTAATTGPETTIANQIQNAVGRALSALTSGQTATNLLIAVGW